MRVAEERTNPFRLHFEVDHVGLRSMLEFGLGTQRYPRVPKARLSPAFGRSSGLSETVAR